ncbi:MAG: exo-alpha-sialidase [Phycisphaerales bacterium]|nr:exo-alpha-sialidase [Phycisphaerales bacterium]
MPPALLLSLALAVADAPRFIDLDGDVSRQTVVDREVDQYLGHVSTVLLADGRTIVAVYPKGHGAGAIVMKRSADGGRTWSERLPTPENWATSQETPTIFRVVDPTTRRERLLLFSGLYPVRLAHSEDEGATWTALEPVGDWGGIVPMGDLFARANGELVALWHDDGRFLHANGSRTDTMTLLQSVSADGGLSWSAPQAIFASKEIHLCEPGVVRSPDGKRIAILLRENRRAKQSHIMFTDDEGRTWSAPRELPASLTGDRHQAKYAPDGRLLVSFRDMAADSPTKGDWVAWVGTWDDLQAGRPGQYRVRLKDNRHAWDCAYPGVEVLPDGTFVLTTYGHWQEGEAPYLLSVRVRVEEIDALGAK